MENQIQQPKIDLKQTTAMLSEDGNMLFAEGTILRKVSKFLIGSNEDAIVPIPCMYDVKTGKPLFDMLPLDIREEVKEFYKNK